MLVFLMIISGTSCSNTAAGTDPADNTEDKARDTALAVFSEKAQALASSSDMKTDVTLKLEKKTGDAVYNEEYEYNLEYSGIGTAGFIAEVDTKAVLEKTVIRSTETYSGGVAAYMFEGEEVCYFAEMKAEDYTERHFPAVIIDPALYETVEYNSESGVFTFSDAESLESWAAPGHAQLITARASAVLEDGELSSMTYEAEFRQGPVSVKAHYELTVGTPSLSADSLTRPASERMVSVDDIDIPMAVRYAYDMLGAGFGTNGKRSDYIYSYASGTEMKSAYEYANSGKGSEAVAKISENSVVSSIQGGTVTSESELLYRDGAATYSENGSEPAPSDISLNDVLTLIDGYNEYNLADRTDMNNITSEHLPDYVIINFDLPSDYGAVVEDTVSESLFGDKDYLDSYAASYATDKLKAYMCIDKDTGFVTGSGVEYIGIHVIEGQSCPLVYTSNSVCRLADPEAYTVVTGEPAPSDEPEEKPTPSFYVVTSPEGGKMYLFGTIHVADGRMSYLPSEITEALSGSDALALEINNDTLEQRLLADPELMTAYSQGKTYGDGSSNKTRLPKDAYESLRRIAKVIGDTVYTELYYPSLTVSRYEMELIHSTGLFSNSLGAESILTKAAKEKGIEIIEVEQIKDRFKLDSRYPEVTQLYLLGSAAETARADEIGDLAELYELWCAGDEDGLRKMLAEPPLDEDAGDEEKYAYSEYERILMKERDAQMIEKAKEYLASGKTVFFAVGAAHVIGEGGIVDSLRAAGYTVEKVSYK